MIALTDPANGSKLILHPDLYWSDEDTWHPVAQNVARTIQGALDIQAQAMVSGRPITLESDNTYAWMPSSIIEQLRAWAAVPLKQLDLQLRGKTWRVIFRHQDGALQAHCVVHYSDRIPEDRYYITLRLMCV